MMNEDITNIIYEDHYLYPSAIFASKTPFLVKTILGTCVSVCLWDEKMKIGGINHFMLPLWNGEELQTPKYGNIAIEKLILKMQELGASPQDLVAKVFGGKDPDADTKFSFQIGKRNVRVAIDLLKESKIPIVASHTGNIVSRKIHFYTDTGIVHLKTF